MPRRPAVPNHIIDRRAIFPFRLNMDAATFYGISQTPSLTPIARPTSPSWLAEPFFRDVMAAYQAITQRQVDASTNTPNYAGKIWMMPTEEVSSGCLCGDPTHPVPHTWLNCPSTIVEGVVAQYPEIRPCEHEHEETEHTFCFSANLATHDLLCFLLHSPPNLYEEMETDEDSVRLREWMAAYHYNDPAQRQQSNLVVDTHCIVLRGVMETMGRANWPGRDRYGGWVNGERLYWLYGWENASVSEVMDMLLPEIERAAAMRMAEHA